MDALAQAISHHTTAPGVFATAVPELSLMRMDGISSQRHSIVYEPCIYVVAQGRKQAYLNAECYTYDALNYLVLSVPLPLATEVTQASAEQPYLGLKLDINTRVLTELVQLMDGLSSNADNVIERGLFISAMDQDLQGCLLRLLSVLGDSAATAIVAPLIIREILFHVLRSEQGVKLRAFLQQDRNDYRIASAMSFIQQHYAQSIEVPQLAADAGMSSSSFHHYFKQVTDASPLQYLKSIRLHAAKQKIVLNSLAVADAAYQVGYASPSQFSREYRRFFGNAPSLDAANSPS